MFGSITGHPVYKFFSYLEIVSNTKPRKNTVTYVKLLDITGF